MQHSGRTKKSADLRPLRAAAAAALPYVIPAERMLGLPVIDDGNVSTAVASGVQMLSSQRLGSMRAVGEHAIAPTASSGARGGAGFDSRDLAVAVQAKVRGIKEEMMRLPISREFISSVLDLAQVWQRLVEAQQALSGSAGKTAQGLQAASAMAFKYMADPLLGSADGGKHTWVQLNAVLENLVQVSKSYSDSASWLYSKAAELDPRQFKGMSHVVSQASLDTIGVLNKRLEDLLNGRVGKSVWSVGL